MRTLAIASALVVAVVAVAFAQQRAQPPAKSAPAKSQPPAQRGPQPQQLPQTRGSTGVPFARAADEAAIRQLIDQTTRAYNAHDAQAMANLFAEEGEMVDETGHVFQGRGAIAELFKRVFESYPEAAMKIDLDRIRFLTPNLAVEEGTTEIVHQPGRAAERARYVVLYTKQDNRWQVASARDVADERLRASNELDQLAWLIGEWVDESADALVKTSYRWDENHKFILGEFTLQVAGRPAMSGTQRIGWDPLAKQIHSWVFDSDGGFGEGLWNQDGGIWIVKFSGVTADGEVGSATNYYTRLSPDTFAYESHDRMVGGERTEDTNAIIVVRVPPRPGD